MQDLQTIPEIQDPVLAIIARAAEDPNVSADKMERLLEMQFKIMNKQAEIELNQALAKLEPMLKTLTKTKAGAPTKGGTVKFFYTPYEEIDRMMRPVLRECGLSLTFSTRIVADKPYFIAQVQEVTKGACREAMIPYTPDTSSQMNNPQNIASGLSYAKRISVAMLFNLVFEGEDDNAAHAGALTDAELGIIERLLTEREVDRAAFLKFCGVPETSLIPSSLFKEAKSKLEQKKVRS
jgi:hypothetical protein